MSQALLSKIADEGIEYVDIRFTDPRGKLQHVTVCADQVDQDFLEEGFMFDGSSIAGWKSIEESDMKLMPDVDSAYVDPFMLRKPSAFTALWLSRTPAKAMRVTRADVRSARKPI